MSRHRSRQPSAGTRRAESKGSARICASADNSQILSELPSGDEFDREEPGTGTDATVAIRRPVAQRVCLALIAEGDAHGWGIGTELAPDGELGRVWTLSRPLTYRAIEQLERKGVVRRRGSRRGGRERTLLSSTAHGRHVVDEWLDTPVEHLRDVRTELLLKLLLRRRQGLATEPLLAAQQQSFSEHIDTLTTIGDTADPVDLWRRESPRAVRRFLDAALTTLTRPTPSEELPLMRLSARNQLPRPRHFGRSRRCHVDDQDRASRWSDSDRRDHERVGTRSRSRTGRRRPRHCQVDRSDVGQTVMF